MDEVGPARELMFLPWVLLIIAVYGFLWLSRQGGGGWLGRRIRASDDSALEYEIARAEEHVRELKSLRRVNES